MSDFETRKRPLRDTVCDIDADIINLIMRRHNMLTRMAGRKKNPGSQDEKMIREDWEARVAKVSGDPRRSGLFFSLMALQPRPHAHEHACLRLHAGLQRHGRRAL